MTVEQDRRIPLSTEAPTGRAEFDPQLSAWSSDETARLAIGQLIGGRYRIERELGEGGMGVVYLATDEQVPGERFAIKVIKEELHAEALALLREEVRKTRKLSHPNIIDVHSVNLDGHRLFVLMEYLEGKPLDALLNEEYGRGMPFSRAWPIIEDVGTALGNAHDHSVIHSDLKPANIFVTNSGRTKLLDFGIARVSRGPRLEGPVGMRALTPAYASCEMLEGKEADQRDDIYSYACVIYEMLSGERPFGRLTALEARKARATVSPIRGLSRGQNAALCRALAFGRGARTGTVEELLAKLGTPAKSPSRLVLLGALILAAIAAIALTYGVLKRPEASGQSLIFVGTPATGHSADDPPPNSIAVLPFVNISGDANQEYFSDGLSEELIDHLVHSTDLKVIARTSSFQYKGKTGDVRSIARALRVSNLLEGSVRTDGRQLRVTAQLVRGSDGVQIWSQTYNRDLVAIFKVQDEISEKVAQALNVALRSAASAPLSEPDIRAYNLVLEGNYFKARRNLRDVGKAAELYQQAIKITPDYALAWARLASAYLMEEILRGQPSEDQSRRVIDALDRAVELDPNLAWAYYTRAGFQGTVLWNWAAARADTERVREIDPRFAYLPIAAGDLSLAYGEADKAVERYQDYLAQNPLDPSGLNSLGVALCAAGRLQECLQTRLNLMQLHPEFGGVNRSVGTAYLFLGQYNAALKAMQSEPNEAYKLNGLALIYWAMGRHSDSDAALNSLTAKPASIDPYEIASIHAFRGEVDEAFQWLDRAYRVHDYGILGLKTDPLLRNLHGDPRFQELLTQMRLTGDDGHSKQSGV
jgi:TolB-like protein/tRNA A-37 threonylcarbamoyl transferase component Bud32